MFKSDLCYEINWIVTQNQKQPHHLSYLDFKQVIFPNF